MPKLLTDADYAKAQEALQLASQAVATAHTILALAVDHSDVPPDAIRPYDAASPWNTPIPAGVAVLPNSAALIGAIFDNGLKLTCDPDQYTIPVYIFDSKTPLVTVTGNGYFSTYDAGDSTRVGHGSPWTAQVPLPAGALGGVGSDGQIVLWDPVAGVEWGLWQLTISATGATASNAYRTHTTAGYNGRFGDAISAGRGAGTTYLAGLVRRWEIAQGNIAHALAFGYSSPAPSFVYPAGKSDGAGKAGVDVPEGTRLQLDPAMTDAAFDALGLGSVGKMIARALQKYGAYVIDNSGSSKIYLEARTTAKWDTTITRDIVSAIPWSRFRAVAPPAKN